MADVSSLQSEYEYPIVHHFSYFTSFPSTGTHTNWFPISSFITNPSFQPDTSVCVSSVYVHVAVPTSTALNPCGITGFL